MKKGTSKTEQPCTLHGVKNCDYDIFVCYDCGYEDNINYMDVNCATDADPNPVVSCPKCGGCCEQLD